MLSYAFRLLREEGYQKVGSEDFENTTELFAAILIQGITLQIKRGLGREYVEKMESLSAPKGKINITESIKKKSPIRKQLVCTYDEFSVNARMNQIIKSTGLLLLRSDISAVRRKELRRLLVYFSDVEEVDLRRANWLQPEQSKLSAPDFNLSIAVLWLTPNRGKRQNKVDEI